MAKNDKSEGEDTEIQIKAPKENVMAKKDDEPSPAAPSLEGLVKMKRGDQTIHAHPTAIHDHVKNGWKHA
jgi:hypothetical protein